jgi:hypothetical protein
VGTNGCFVGEIFFKAAARALNKDISIFSDIAGFAVQRYSGGDNSVGHIKVGYLNENHYVGILPSSAVYDEYDEAEEEDYDALPRDASPRDASPRDASPRDASPRDASPRDASPRDASPRDDAPRDDALTRDASPPPADDDHDKDDENNYDYPADDGVERDEVSADEQVIVTAAEESQTMIVDYEYEDVSAGVDTTAAYETEQNQIAETLLSFSALKDGSILSQQQSEMLGEKAMSSKLGFTKDATTVTYFAPAIHETVTVTVAEESKTII